MLLGEREVVERDVDVLAADLVDHETHFVRRLTRRALNRACLTRRSEGRGLRGARRSAAGASPLGPAPFPRGLLCGGFLRAPRSFAPLGAPRPAPRAPLL